MGIRYASCLGVGRVAIGFDASCPGAEPSAHRTSATSHLGRGPLNCVEVPVSTDLSVDPIDMPNGITKYPDLTPDNDWEAAYGISYATTITNIVKQILTDGPKVPYLALVTHNHIPYSDAEHHATKLLCRILEEIQKICISFNIEIQGATIPQIADMERDLSNPAPYLLGTGGLELATVPKPLDLAGKVVMISGASRGIGLAIAQEYLRNNYVVSLGGRDVDKLKKIFGAWGDRVHYAHFDAFEEETIAPWVTAAVERYGRIDVLVNNAGHSELTEMADLDVEAVKRHLAVNTYAPMSLTKECLAHLNKSGSGRVVFIGSMSGLRQINEYAPYNMSKAALLAFAETFRFTCWRDGHGVRVATICPGFVNTQMSAFTDQLKGLQMTQVEEIAFIVRFVTERSNEAEMPILQVRPKHYPRHG